MMEEINHIVDKFWAGTATDAEKQRIIRQLTQDEQTWQASLRNEFDQNLQRTEKPLTDSQSSLVLARLHRQILGNETLHPVSVFRRNWMVWAAAAMLVLVGGWLTYQYTSESPTTPIVAQQRSSQPWQLTRKTNTGNTVMNVALMDGSTIKLQPRSSVSYYEPFGKPSRNISLTGDALFTVAKDPNHPFVVLANGFTTTALGTQFWVRAAKSENVSVQLLEGRVVVRATPESGLSMTDTYLKPGQEFTVDRKTKQIRVEPMAQPATPTVQVVTTKPVPTPVSWLRFSKEPLANVLTEVGKRYNVQIEVDPADVQGLSFSGTFIPSDSLRVVLGAVCSMNNLSFKQEPDKIIISKSPE
ncbi:FecR family protein [Spirosoma daeguense]